MSYLRGLGARVKALRESRSLDRTELARRTGVPEETLAALEDGNWEKPQGFISNVERLARELDVLPEEFLFADTCLIDSTLNGMKLAAFRIMQERRFVESAAEVEQVFSVLEKEYTDAFVASGDDVLAYRKKEQVRRVDEDRVRDILSSIRRAHGSNGKGSSHG